MEEAPIKAMVRGFTLIELLITISMVMILLTVVAPSFTGLVNSNQQRTSRDLLISALNTAQQQALSKNIFVYLCPTSDGLSCSQTWNNNTGWLVYEDLDRDAVFDTPGEIILSQTKSDIKSITNATALIQFKPTGHVASASTFTLCSYSLNQTGTQISISMMGAIEHSAGGTCSA